MLLPLVKAPSFLATAALLAEVLLAKETVEPRDDPIILRRACPPYSEYSKVAHRPFSDGPLKLPFQRPSPECRTFESSLVEKVINDVYSRMVDLDLRQIFRNALPNTLDTTIAWHVNNTTYTYLSGSWEQPRRGGAQWNGPQTFIVTGDINAEWLRDSTNQLAPYLALARHDSSLQTLILGAINTQAEFVIQSPYCNAFQAPEPSRLRSQTDANQAFHNPDEVHPGIDHDVVFECKYELDSLAHFLSLGNQYFENTGLTDHLTYRWYLALDTVIQVLDEQSRPTFDAEGHYQPNKYSFTRLTRTSTETLGLSGMGNPLNSGTGLIRSAFRPSDDATIFGFFIPPNAMMAVQLKRTADTIAATKNANKTLIDELRSRATKLTAAVMEYGVVTHKNYGKVFAFEVDGYGSHVMMDDANLPSLLSLPYLGFLSATDAIYQNTRKMILSQSGNPYYLNGTDFHGVGGPHIDLKHAWPMSLLMQAYTSDSDSEILECLNLVRDSSLLGLIHESVNVNNIKDYTRSWFAWANSLFAQTILKVAMERPQLIFGKGAENYVLPSP